MAATSVLLIDDSETDLLYSQIMLERATVGVAVLALDSADQALHWLEAAGAPQLDLILLDLNMPGMNGFEFLGHYQALWPDLSHPAPVVVLSSSPLPQDRERALAHACVRGYLTKPLTPAAIAELRPWLSLA